MGDNYQSVSTGSLYRFTKLQTAMQPLHEYDLTTKEVRVSLKIKLGNCFSRHFNIKALLSL